MILSGMLNVMKKKPRSWRPWVYRIVISIVGLILIVWIGRKTMTGWRKPTYWQSTPTVGALIIQERLKGHITTLSETIGDRRVGKDTSLQQAAAYIINQFKESGYAVAFQTYTVAGHTVQNILATRTGTAAVPKMVVVGAHYDTYDNPGADDNASGVALLLELARTFAQKQPYYTVQFVAFVNEEPPFFKTAAMGSNVFAHVARQRQEPIAAALILESLGYYTDEPNSQLYPPFFGWLYPNAGNFLAVVSNFSSRRIVNQVTAAFRETSSFPLESISTTAMVPGIDFSDNWSFWEEGYPAVMLSDGALYRNPHYHRDTDTVETINFPAMGEVFTGLVHVVDSMANAH